MNTGSSLTPIVPIACPLDAFIRTHWLTDQAIRLYALVIGEGRRFPAARKLFWEQFDRLWQVAFGYVCERSPNLERAVVEPRLQRQLLDRLRQQ